MKRLETILVKLQQLENLGETLAQISREVVDLLTKEVAEEPAPDEGSTQCPKCGSQQLTDVSGMGVSEFRCNQCNHISKGVLDHEKQYIEEAI